MEVNEGSCWSLVGGGIDNDRYPYRKLIGSGLRDLPERYEYSYLILEKAKFTSVNYPTSYLVSLNWWVLGEVLRCWTSRYRDRQEK